MMGAHFQQRATDALQGGGSLRATGEFLPYTSVSYSQADVCESASEAKPMDSSLRNSARKVRGDSRNTSALPPERVNQEWLKAQAQRYSAKDGANVSGVSEKAFENLRQGRNKISFDKMVQWAQRDPDFAAAWAEHVGLILPGEAEFAGALTKAFNAFQRRGQ